MISGSVWLTFSYEAAPSTVTLKYCNDKGKDENLQVTKN